MIQWHRKYVVNKMGNLSNLLSRRMWSQLQSSRILHQQLGLHINWVTAMVSSKNNQLQMSYSVCTWKKHKYSSKCGFKYNQGANHFSSMWSPNKKSKTKWRHFATISIWHHSEQKLSWESYKSKHQQTQVQKASGELLHSQQRKRWYSNIYHSPEYPCSYGSNTIVIIPKQFPAPIIYSYRPLLSNANEGFMWSTSITIKQSRIMKHWVFTYNWSSRECNWQMGITALNSYYFVYTEDSSH